MRYRQAPGFLVPFLYFCFSLIGFWLAYNEVSTAPFFCFLFPLSAGAASSRAVSGAFAAAASAG